MAHEYVTITEQGGKHRGMREGWRKASTFSSILTFFLVTPPSVIVDGGSQGAKGGRDATVALLCVKRGRKKLALQFIRRSTHPSS